MTDSVEVPVDDLTPKQLLKAIYRSQLRVEKRMTQLSQEVADLKAAVDGVAQRLLPQIAVLRAERDALSADAQAAVDAIDAETQRLNGMGAEPSTPVDPNPTNPVEPPPVGEPTDPTTPTDPTL